MSVLTALCSRFVPDYNPPEDLTLKFEYDKKGLEVPTFVPTDFKSIVESHGIFSQWSLERLISAGINPDMPVHTGASTRLDSDNNLESAINEGLKIIDSNSKEESLKTE